MHFFPEQEQMKTEVPFSIKTEIENTKQAQLRKAVEGTDKITVGGTTEWLKEK